MTSDAPRDNRHDRLDWIQAARALAAVSVALFHAAERVGDRLGPDAPPFLSLFAGGGVGVDLFFVISGFIIAHVHWGDIGDRGALRRYAARRIVRIYPVYWALCAVILPLYFLFPNVGDGWQREPGHILASLALLYVPPGPIIGVAWTLTLEIAFYAMFAMLIVSRTWGIAAFATWAGLCAFNMATAAFQSYPFDFLFNPRFVQFFVGMAIARLYRRIAPGPAWALTAICGAAFVALPALFAGASWWERPGGWERPIVTIVCGGLIAGFAGLNAATQAPRSLVALGNATYSIYLVHGFAGWVADAALRRAGAYAAAPPEVLFVALVAVMIAAGWIAYLLVERPLLAALRKPAQPRTRNLP